MSQLDLFTSKKCHYCDGGGLKSKNPNLWDGFLDRDTDQLVCTACRDTHYIEKARSMGTLKKKKIADRVLEEHINGYVITAMTYSEMPVMAT